MKSYMEMIEVISDQKELIEYLVEYIKELKRGVVGEVNIAFRPDDLELGLMPDEWL